MRDVQRRRVQLLMQGLDLLAQRQAQAGIQTAERLIEQKHRRLAHQGPAQGHALPLTARQGRRLAVQQVRRGPGSPPPLPRAAAPGPEAVPACAGGMPGWRKRSCGDRGRHPGRPSRRRDPWATPPRRSCRRCESHRPSGPPGRQSGAESSFCRSRSARRRPGTRRRGTSSVTWETAVVWRSKHLVTLCSEIDAIVLIYDL